MLVYAKLANNPSVSIASTISAARYKSINTYSGRAQLSKNQAAITRTFRNAPMARANVTSSIASHCNPSAP